jgi:hypothetical protein
MCKEAVSVPAELVSVLRELVIGQVYGNLQQLLKSSVIGNRPGPVVLSGCFREELAPLKNSNIKKIIVNGDPEVDVLPLGLTLGQHLNVSEIANGVLTQRAGSLKASAAIHGLRGLTFELTGPLRRDGLARAGKMYRVPQAGPRRPAVAGPVVQRGVRPHFSWAVGVWEGFQTLHRWC